MPELDSAAAVILVAVPGYLTAVTLPAATAVCRRFGWTARNFQGRLVPVGLGLVLAAAFVSAVGLQHLVGGGQVDRGAAAAALFMLAVALVGWIDDRWGEASPKGLAGHLTAMARGNLTTGQLKVAVAAVAGTMTAWWLLPQAPLHQIAAATVLLAGSTNLINLLDLRPGRALKGLWLVTAAAALAVPLPFWFWGVVGATVIYAPWDLAGRSMLGDAGSAALGAALGAVLVQVLTPGAQLAAAASVVALNAAAEHLSLSRVIDRIPPLRYLDALGRSADHHPEAGHRCP